MLDEILPLPPFYGNACKNVFSF